MPLFYFSVDGDGNLQFAHVTMHDGRENLIYQCAATSPVLDEEYRSGDEIKLTVKPGSKNTCHFSRFHKIDFQKITL